MGNHMSADDSTTDKRITILLVCLISVIALFIRVQYVNHTSIYRPIRADARQYVLYGYNLAHHGTFSQEFPASAPSPDSFRSPGYPMVIALAFLLGGEQGYYPIVIYCQVVLSTLLVPLTFFLGLRFLPPWGSLAAALLVALSPHLISMAGYVLTETLFAFLLLSAILSYYIALKRHRPILFILAGLLFGFAYLTNETALIIPLLLAAMTAVSPGLGKAQSKINHPYLKLGVFLIIFLLFPAVWASRNSTLPTTAARSSDRAIATLSHGTYPDFIYKDPRFQYFPYREDPMQPDFGSSLATFGKIFWQRFTERPGRYLLWYLSEKPYYFWSWNILQGQGDIYVYPVQRSLYTTSTLANATREAMKYLHPIMLILFLAGMPLLYVTRRKAQDGTTLSVTPIILFAVCIYYTILYSVFAPWPRYSVPLRPELYLIAIWSFRTAGIIILEKMKLHNEIRKSSTR